MIAAGALAAGLVPTAANAATSTVSFDDLQAGSQVTAYPAARPVIEFGDPGSFGFQTGGPADGLAYTAACGPVFVAADGDTHSPPNMGDFGRCGGLEGGTFPNRGSFAKLLDLTDAVGAYVGSPDASDTFELDAYDQSRHLLGSKSITAGSAGPNNLIQFRTPGIFDIAYVALYEKSAPFSDPATLIGIDDLSLDLCTPGLNCVPSIELPPAKVGVTIAQSATAQYRVNVQREDGSNGPVALALPGLPFRSGITATFNPSTLSGTQTTSTLTVTIDATARLEDWTGSITATPQASGAGTTTATEPAEISVVEPFQVGAGSSGAFTDTPLPQSTTMSVRPCSSASTDVRTGLGPHYTGSPVQLNLSYSGDLASIPPGNVRFPGAFQNTTFANPGDFDPGGYRDQTLTVLRDGTPTPNDSAQISITPTGPPGITGQAAAITVDNAPPVITGIRHANNGFAYGGQVIGAFTPQATQPGTEVAIDGQGFCPGSYVEFGNPEATVAPGTSNWVSMNPSGTQIVVMVPTLATSGPVTVVSGGAAKQPGMIATSSSSIRIDNYRNVAGFSFRNFTPSIQDHDMQDAFGFSQTYDSVDACVIGCTVTYLDPMMWVLEQVAKKTIGKNGNCFGFTLAPYRLRGGVLADQPRPLLYGGPFDGNVGDVNPLTQNEQIADYGISTDDFITGSAIQQFSYEFMTPWATRFLAQNAAGSANAAVSVYNEISSILAQGRFAMVSLLDNGQGHVVTAYRLEGVPPNYYIYVYDSNDPYNYDSSRPPGQVHYEDTDGGFHQTQLKVSRIAVNSGSWTLASSGYQGHIADFGIDVLHGMHDSGLVVTDPSTIPDPPTPITNPAVLAGLYFFSGDLGSSTPAPGSGPSLVTQISDGAGHTLLDSHGNLNQNPATRLPGAPFAALTGGAARAGQHYRAPLSFFFPGRLSTLQATLRDTGTGTDTHTLLGRGFVSQVTTQAHAGAVDRLAAGATGASFATTAPSKPVTLSLLERHGSGAARSTRTIAITTTSYDHGADALVLSANSTSVMVTHRGPATHAALTLSVAGSDALPQTFTTGAIPLAANGSAVVSNIAWSALGRSSVRVRVGGRTYTIGNHHHQAALAAITSLRAARLSDGKVSLTIATRTIHAPTGARVSLVWAIRSGRTLVASHVSIVPAGRRNATFKFAPPHKGRYTIIATVVVTADAGLGLTASSASRRLAYEA